MSEALTIALIIQAIAGGFGILGAYVRLSGRISALEAKVDFVIRMVMANGKQD